MKRGHSNVEAEKTKPWSEVDKDVNEGIARVPLSGGATYTNWRELPPLALRREEWEEIGRLMNW